MQEGKWLLGYGMALASAALVGLFTVLNKWLLVESVPALTAGAWTYFAAGIALNALGNFLIALGYVGWATENNLGRVLGEDMPAVTLVCLKAIVAGVVMAILALAFGKPITISWHFG